jgi:hypothetical protein
MKKQNRLFWLGLLIYIASFSPTAVVGRELSFISVRGYDCAYLSLVAPWGEDYRNSVTKSVPLEISGLINLVFLAAVLLILRGTQQRLVRALRIAVLLMIPFSWIVFYVEQLYPREGYVLWIAGMILVLFSAARPSKQNLDTSAGGAAECAAGNMSDTLDRAHP